ncbi:hypothetical protein [Sphingobacterium yanglingense]|uniref:Uncharacterized protein n=1 Tax=Sphingobacterium yanglingense TaxID=1437280 RepID=A0A4R6WBC0_9SPHI|nr:hypothetical protein [Sphingobacterium yanglingense]TDQ72273.1 hypothetical protein CLV99_4737 [Sphingobacterium yanglingense]
MNNKKSIYILISLIVIAAAGITIWGYSVLNNIENDKEQTLNLSKRILEYFPDHLSIYKYPVEPAKPTWQKDYLVIENGGHDELGITYKAKWNEKLGTAANYPGEDVKGLVVIAQDMLERGEYISKLGQKDKAYQRNYIISYFDMGNKVVVARDTLYGEEPPSNKRSTGSVAGEFPTDQAVVDAISNRLQ